MPKKNGCPKMRTYLVNKDWCSILTWVISIHYIFKGASIDMLLISMMKALVTFLIMTVWVRTATCDQNTRNITPGQKAKCKERVH